MARGFQGEAGSLARAIADEVAARLARERHSQAWLADQTGKSPNYISSRLRPNSPAPFDLNDIALIAAALDTTPTELFVAAERNLPGSAAVS